MCRTCDDVVVVVIWATTLSGNAAAKKMYPISQRTKQVEEAICLLSAKPRRQVCRDTSRQ
jgi:hypothetical protein